MPIPRNLRSFLKDHQVAYKPVYHSSAYTGQQLAHTEHVSGHRVLKVVLVKGGTDYYLAILPAAAKIDFRKLRSCIRRSDIELATEAEMRKLFPDCEIGAIPPFGVIYHLPLFADQSINEDDRVLVAAGTHRDAIELKYKDLLKWAKPTVGAFTQRLQ